MVEILVMDCTFKGKSSWNTKDQHDSFIQIIALIHQTRYPDWEDVINLSKGSGLASLYFFHLILIMFFRDRHHVLTVLRASAVPRQVDPQHPVPKDRIPCSVKQIVLCVLLDMPVHLLHRCLSSVNLVKPRTEKWAQ